MAQARRVVPFVEILSLLFMAELKINVKDLNTNITLIRHKKIHRFKKIFGTMIGLKTS